MKAVLQRVSEASVAVDQQVVGRIGRGLVILLGVEQGDSDTDSTFLARKTAQLRIFADGEGRMNRSVMDVGGQVLVISQFTLIADWRKGRRPGFTNAAAPDEGNRLYEHFVAQLESMGIPVEKGIFGADMKVSLLNDGPVTLILENQFQPRQAS